MLTFFNFNYEALNKYERLFYFMWDNEQDDAEDIKEIRFQGVED